MIKFIKAHSVNFNNERKTVLELEDNLLFRIFPIDVRQDKEKSEKDYDDLLLRNDGSYFPNSFRCDEAGNAIEFTNNDEPVLYLMFPFQKESFEEVDDEWFTVYETIAFDLEKCDHKGDS